MHWIDWTILGGLVVILCIAAYTTKKYMRSVADFLAANRTAGKYLLGVAEGIAGLGAITIVANFEMKYKAGFTAVWWEMMVVPVMVICAMTGWVQYRYRQSRVMTMAQMLEIRYSRSFRVFAGFLAYLSGVVNFGLFPAVGGRFFQHYCGFKANMVSFAGLEFDLTYAIIMLILLGIALAFTFAGGQIAVIVTDFLQGTFCNVVLVILTIVLLFGVFSWPKIMEAVSVEPEQAAVRMMRTAAANTDENGNPENKDKLFEMVFARAFNVLPAETVTYDPAYPEVPVLGASLTTAEEKTYSQVPDKAVLTLLGLLSRELPIDVVEKLPTDVIAAIPAEYTGTFPDSVTENITVDSPKASPVNALKATYEQLVMYETEKVSLINPAKSSGVDNFNWTFFIMQAFIIVYGFMIWQGNQGYYGSAKNPHEAKMGKVVGQLRFVIQTIPLVLIPICAYTFLHHAAYAEGAKEAFGVLNSIGNEQLQSQLTVSVAASKFLPIGLLGAFAAVMLAAFISTHDTYLHAWGSIFIQDIVMPVRQTILKKNKPLSPESHIMWLRIGIAVVAVYIFIFALFFNQRQDIFMFFALTGTIFLSWGGAVVIGGLYWKYGTTAGAWAAAIFGLFLAVLGWYATYFWVSLQTICAEKLSVIWNPLAEAVPAVAGNSCPLNGQEIAFWSSILIILMYIVVSLITCRGRAFDMDRMLHRGKYAIESDVDVAIKAPKRSIMSRLGMGKEFSLADRILYLGSYVYIFFFFGVFLIGTLYMLFVGLPDSFWGAFWFWFCLILLVIMVVLTVWFFIGGVHNLKAMFQKLKTMKRDDFDDGTVVGHQSLADVHKQEEE
jgi:SSS family solute:Na+ symporter